MTRRNYRVAAGVAAGLGAVAMLLGGCQSSGSATSSELTTSGGPADSAGAQSASNGAASDAGVPADVPKAPQVINNSGQKGLVYNCDGQEQVTVNGSTNSITLLGTCRQVTVNGTSNEVGIAAADQITTNGNGNRVTYGGNPQVSDNGSGNDVHPGTVSAPAGGGNTGGDANAPGAGTAPERIIGSGLNQTYDCGNRSVSVLGSQSTLRFTGVCESVTVTGSGNTIKISAVGSITVLGNTNKVSWTSGATGGSPQVRNVGNDNSVTQG